MGSGMTEQQASGNPIVVLVGGDLMARARLEAAARHAGAEVTTIGLEDLESSLEERATNLVVIDLDEGRDAALEVVAAARARGLITGRVVGYFSHIDEALGEAARQAGCEAVPRGRFWRTVPDLLRASG